MSKKHKKRKKSRRERKVQPQNVAATTQVPVESAVDSSAPTPSEPASEGGPSGAPAEPSQPASRPTITATFKPAQPSPHAAPAVSLDEETEYTSVRKDLRKLGVTIVALILVVAGLTVLNNQTGFVNTLGEQLFHLWE